MARIPYADPAVPEHAEAAAHIVASRKKLGHLHRMLLHSPPVAMGWIQMYDAVRWKTVLSGKLRELVMCQVAAINGAEYEWAAHAPIALKEGVSQAQLDALSAWRERPDDYTALQRDVLALCDAMTRDVHVDEALVQAVRAALGERQLVELVGTIAAYNMVSRFLEALGIQASDVREG